MSQATGSPPWWTVAAPVLGLAALAASWGRHPSALVAGVLAAFLVVAVLAAVHHAEVVAHRVGEPFGSLVLAVAVTVIEVALMSRSWSGARGRTRPRWPATRCSPP